MNLEARGTSTRTAFLRHRSSSMVTLGPYADTRLCRCSTSLCQVHLHQSHRLCESEVVVAFDPTAIGASELLCDARVMVVVYPSTTHVVAVFRHESATIGGRVAFRKYDNDSDSRRRGTYELTNARRLWVRSEVTAATRVGSALHRAVIAFRDRPRETVDITSPERRAPTRMRMDRM